MIFAIKAAYGQEACLWVLRGCQLLSQLFHWSVHFHSIPMWQVTMITPFSGYGNSPQYWSLTCHTHDPEVAIRESLAQEISTLEKRNHDKFWLKQDLCPVNNDTVRKRDYLSHFWGFLCMHTCVCVYLCESIPYDELMWGPTTKKIFKELSKIFQLLWVSMTMERDWGQGGIPSFSKLMCRNIAASRCTTLTWQWDYVISNQCQL